MAKLLAEETLGVRAGFLIGTCVETAGGYLGGEPICFGETEGQGNEAFFHLSLGQVFAYFV